MQGRRVIMIGSGIALIALLIFLLRPNTAQSTESEIVVKVEAGQFEASVKTTGELQARRSLDIMGPSGLRQAGIWQVQITDLVEEGTIVAEGEYVGELDRTEASSKLSNLEAEIEKFESQLTQARLDTTLNLRDSREQLVNLQYQFEEAKITLEQSKYEPPATIRQAEITLEKSQRALEQATENYRVKQEKDEAKMNEIMATLVNERKKREELIGLLDKFEITAPADGMVIYIRDWNGEKRGVGSTVSPWQNSVATLPDLSEMVSITYVNEVDISRLKKEQEVEVTIDAFPDKRFSGKVLNVANIGEQRPNSDAKVFEVKIELNEQDTTLRPSMTTGNRVITSREENALFLPSECIHTTDSLTFVYLKKDRKVIKREVVPGIFNENETVILSGLEADDEVYLSTPANGATAIEWLDETIKNRQLADEQVSAQP